MQYKYTATYFIENEDGKGERKFVRFNNLDGEIFNMVIDCNAFYVYDNINCEEVRDRGFAEDLMADAEEDLIHDYNDNQDNDIDINLVLGISL